MKILFFQFKSLHILTNVLVAFLLEISMNLAKRGNLLGVENLVSVNNCDFTYFSPYLIVVPRATFNKPNAITNFSLWW